MKLAVLAKQIAKVTALEAPLGEPKLYASLDFRGPRNAHLAIPSSYTPENRLDGPQRHEPLTGNEDILGDALVFDYASHDNRMELWDYGSLDEAKAHVIGDAGIFNVWTEIILVFHHFRLRRYEASYRGPSGTRVIWRGEHTKGDRTYPDRKLAWLGPYPDEE